MKNRIFLLITLFMMITSVQANKSNTSNDNWDYISYNHQRPITFNERGIKFYIYQNGAMNFRKPQSNLYYNTNSYYGDSYYYRNGRKIKKTRRTPRNYNSTNLRIGYDYHGRVNRINSVYIHYNYYGKILNIGSVNMSYRRNHLTRVGNLQILRDRYGNTKYIGHVKPHGNYYNTGYYSFYNDYFYDDYIYGYEDDFFMEDDFDTNYEQFEEDDQFYYYRSKTKSSKKSKSGKMESKRKMIKRKKDSKLNTDRLKTR